MAPTLTYFALPGRGEVARLLYTISGTQFEDKRISQEQWKELKPTAPFGQLPILEVDGKVLAQSGAIDRYIAKTTGLLPEDPWAAALADQAYFIADDIWTLVAATRSLPTPVEQVKARQALLAGALGDKLKLLEKLVVAKRGKWLAGDELTHGDLAVFSKLSSLQSGLLDGIPTDLLDSYPVLREFRNSIVAVPQIAAFYSKEDDDIRNKGYKARPGVAAA